MRTADAPPMSFAVPGGGRIRLTAGSRQAALEAVAERLAAGRGFTLATLNLDHLVKLRASEAFRNAYAAADIVTADGAPVVWLARLAGRPVSLAPGSELIEPLCDLAARAGAPIALFGASAETLDRAAARLREAHPGLEVALAVAPPLGFDPHAPEAETHARRIAESGARLCFLALGAPKQEIFAARAAPLAPACGFVSIGAGLDFIAGVQVRAPRWIRRLAMEWLWRLVGNPGRLAGRYARCVALLPALTVEAIGHRAARES